MKFRYTTKMDNSWLPMWLLNRKMAVDGGETLRYNFKQPIVFRGVTCSGVENANNVHKDRRSKSPQNGYIFLCNLGEFIKAVDLPHVELKGF